MAEPKILGYALVVREVGKAEADGISFHGRMQSLFHKVGKSPDSRKELSCWLGNENNQYGLHGHIDKDQRITGTNGSIYLIN